MKCPTCKSEVGNQSVCPYCGGTIYLRGNSWNTEEYNRRISAKVDEEVFQSRRGADTRVVERMIRGLERKINLMLVLQCGMFALLVLVLLTIALK